MFKPTVIKKVSGMLVLSLVISMLTPVLAFAGIWFGDVTYKDGTVTGTVYTDQYDPDGVTINVYNYDNEKHITTTEATYDATVSGSTYWYYQFSKNIGNSYNHLNLLAESTVTGSVYKDVYNTTIKPPIYFPPIWGGIGDGDTSSEMSVGTDGQVNANTLANLLKQHDQVTAKLSGDFVIIPVSALLEADGKRIKVAANNGATYVYPIHVPLIQDWMKQLNEKAEDLFIKISLSNVSGLDLEAIQAAADAIGAKLLTKPMDFSVSLLAKERIVEVDNMGTYVLQTLPLQEKTDPKKATGAVFVNGKLNFVPSIFPNDENQDSVMIKRHSNSIYVAIEHERTFDDVSGHWAREYIELLANKLIVDGATDTSFEPERNITRAEFAALITRALGLYVNSAGYTFTDVAPDAWYASVVRAAAQAGIVDGYEDGSFRPNNPINREELAAMVVRALKFAGQDVKLGTGEQSQLLAKFYDSNAIVWAHAEMAAAIHIGIVDGMTDVTLAPRDEATRAQSAAMLKRLLTTATFINQD